MLSCVRVCVFRASESVRVCRPGAAPGAPKRPQDPPKSTQRGPKRPPRVLQEAPRGPQEIPRAGQEDKFFFEILICLACNYCECFVSLCMTEKQANFKDALLKCRATGWRTGMPKHGGRAAVSPQRGRQLNHNLCPSLDFLSCLFQNLPLACDVQHSDHLVGLT